LSGGAPLLAQLGNLEGPPAVRGDEREYPRRRLTVIQQLPETTYGTRRIPACDVIGQLGHDVVAGRGDRPPDVRLVDPRAGAANERQLLDLAREGAEAAPRPVEQGVGRRGCDLAAVLPRQPHHPVAQLTTIAHGREGQRSPFPLAECEQSTP